MGVVTPFVWYDSEAEQAAQLYTSLVPNSRIVDVSRYGAAGPGPAGSVMTVTFELDGQRVVALNGGPAHPLTEAFSLVLACETQDEVDRYWEGLSAGGEEGPCGWLKDRFGLSWQIVPNALLRLLGDPDPARSQRTMQAMLQMKKLDVAALEAAAAG